MLKQKNDFYLKRLFQNYTTFAVRFSKHGKKC